MAAMKKTFTSICILLAAISAASAQEFATSYFLDNNLYSYRINPAIPGEKNFVGIVVSNVNLSLGSNLGINSILYPKADGSGLVTGLHSSVSPEQFIGNLPKYSIEDQVFNYNIGAAGFWTKNAFHNIEVNVKEDVFAGIPRDLFEFAKCGSRDYPYDISNTAVSVKSFLEFAYGYTRKINDKFTVGGRLKFLMGLAAGTMDFKKGDLTVNGKNIAYDVDAGLRLSSNFLELGTKDNSSIYDFSAFNLDAKHISPCGWGGAADLGVTYKPEKNLTISFSLLNLGFISWKYNIVGKSVKKDVFTGETIKSDGSDDGDMQRFIDKIATIVDFEKVDGTESASDMLSCTVNLGARYSMPFYERLSVGLLASYEIDKFTPCMSARLGATVTPVDWLSITGNYGINSYCKTFGVAMSLNAATINFMFGYEGYSGAVSKMVFSDTLTPSRTPLGPFMNMVKFGVNITFGPRHNNFKPVGTSFIHGRKAE